MSYFSHVYIFPAVTEVGHFNSAASLDCGIAIEDNSNRPILKIFNQNGGTVEEEDTTRRENGKKYLVLRNKKTNKVLRQFFIFILYV